MMSSIDENREPAQRNEMPVLTYCFSLFAMSTDGPNSLSPGQTIYTGITSLCPPFCGYVVLFAIGTLLGAFINWFADTCAWTPKYRSPWRVWPTTVQPCPKRRWFDYLPVVGWLTMSRFAVELFPKPGPTFKSTAKKSNRQNGTATPDPVRRVPGMEHSLFWFRPMLVELGFGAFILWLYCLQVDLNGMTLEKLFFYSRDITIQGHDYSRYDLTMLFWIDVFLFVMLFAASLIDFDDYIIPDVINIPGTVLGLALFTVFPYAVFVPIYWFMPTAEGVPVPTTDLVRYFEAIAAADSPVRYTPLILMQFCWTLWCFAALDRLWCTRFGLVKGICLFFRVLRRSRVSRVMAVLYPVGLALIALVYCLNPGAVTETGPIVTDEFESVSGNALIYTLQMSCRSGLLNSLVGMTTGLLLVWGVRLIGRWSLGQESMGFGDVMLMALIGAFVGWQGTLVVFFLAPFAGIVFGSFRLMFGMRREIPYGPFLCLGTVVYLMARNRFWTLFEPLLNDPLLVLMLFAAGMILLALLLWTWRIARACLARFRRHS